MIYKRIISALTSLAVLATTTSVLSGCSLKEFFSNEKEPEAKNAVSDGNISNGEWLAMINDAFGMQVDETAENGELDAAKEWGVVGNEEIDMNAPINDKFVTTTLMRASGFADKNSTDEEIVKSAIEHGVIKDPNQSLTDPSAAAQSLEDAQHAWAHQEFEDHREVALLDNVQNFTDEIDVSEVKISDNNVTIPTENAISLSKDTVYIVPKNEATGEGGAYKVISTINNNDGTTTVKSVPANMEEIYDKIDVSGKFEADLSTFEPASDNVKVSFGNEATGLSNTLNDGMIKPLGFAGNNNIAQLGSKGAESINFEMELGDLTLGASVKDIQLNADIDWDFGIFKGLDIERVYMAVDYTEEVSVKSEFEPFDNDAVNKYIEMVAESNPKIPLGSVKVPICTGISIKFEVNLTVEASGEIGIQIETANTKGFEMTGSSFRAIKESNVISNEIMVSGHAGVYLTFIVALTLDYVVDEIDLLNLELKIGPTLEASAKIHDEAGTDKDMLCIDATGYLAIEVKLYFFKTIMELFDMESSITLYEADANSSPVIFDKIHIENFQRTPGDVCTLEEEETEAPTEPPTIPTGSFVLDKSFVSINAGGGTTIVVRSIPAGYTASDIEWSSSNPSVAAVDGNGNVTAVAKGTAVITAKTKDGKNTMSCAVTVNEVVAVNNAYTSGETEYLCA